MPRKGQFVAFGADAQAGFVAALRGGASVAEAARLVGAHVQTVYFRRRSFAPFAAAWAEAKAAADAAPSTSPLPRAAGEISATALHTQHKRRLIRRRKRAVAFDRARRQAFLDHFAATCNMAASACAAGIGLSAVYRALRGDAAFADGFQEALETGYCLLEAEALRQQRAAQEAYRIAPDPDAAAQSRSFGEVMQLLREYNRGQGRVGRRAERRGGGGGEERWTFETAMALLETKLVAFGVEIPPDPPPLNGEGRGGVAAGPGAASEEADPHPNPLPLAGEGEEGGGGE